MIIRTQNQVNIESRQRYIYINPKSKGNKYILLTNNKVMLVCSKVIKDENIYLRGQVNQDYENAFLTPYPSSIIKVWKVQNLCSHIFEIPLAECASKCIFIEVDGHSYITSLLD